MLLFDDKTRNTFGPLGTISPYIRAKTNRTVNIDGALFIALWIRGQPQKVVHRYIIKIRKTDQNVGGNIPLPQLVIAVDLLRAI